MLTRNRTAGKRRNPRFGSACVDLSAQHESDFKTLTVCFYLASDGSRGEVLSGCGGFDRVVLILVPVLSLQEDEVDE